MTDNTKCKDIAPQRLNDSKIEKLIAELCPEGVEFKELGEVAKYSKQRVAATVLNDENYVGVDNLLPNKQGKTKSSYVPTTGNLTRFASGDVLLGNIRPYLKKIWLASHDGGTNGDVLAIKINNKKMLQSEFLYYLLTSDDFFRFDMQFAKGAKMPRGNKDAILKYKIPIPPLAIQQEIVKILDTFTTLEVELEAELEAEMKARKKQYEYSRDELLTFGEDVEWKTLGEVCNNVGSGGTPLSTRSDYYGGDIPWLRTQEVRFANIYDTEVKITEKGLKKSSAKWIPENCVIVAISGATAARSAINKIPLTTNQHCCNLEISPQIANYRYVFHWVSCQYEKLKAFGQGARSDLNSTLIKNFPIQIPPLTEQERIVAILDKFDALVNDISVGLPAELNARRQQYEYYREELLTFESL